MNNANSVLLAFVASFVLTACGGGAQTTDLPPPNGGGGNTGNAVYTGPTARDADVLKFQQEFWSKARTTDRCGNCHNASVGQNPMFVRSDDVNMAYEAALTVVDTTEPSLSRVVEKVSEGQLGHNCWVAEPNVCGSIMTTWIENWLGTTAGGGRTIVLTPPVFQPPGASKNFPADAFGPPSFETIIHQPILAPYCSTCHSSESANAIQPYFADPDVSVAYEAAKSKMDLDTPGNSRFVLRLGNEFHNCWTSNCSSDADVMRTAIATYSGLITATVVDPALVTSGAIRLVDGTLAAGGNRYEDAHGLAAGASLSMMVRPRPRPQRRRNSTTSCRNRVSSRSKHGSFLPMSRRKMHVSSVTRRARRRVTSRCNRLCITTTSSCARTRPA